jgi:hypothetical protein
MAVSAAMAQTAKYPTAIAADADLKVLKNRAQTTLSAALNSTATSFTVASGSAFTANMLVTIEYEILSICQVSGNTLTVGHSSCPNVDGRGFDATSAASHASGKTVNGYIDAWNIMAALAEIKAIETALGINLANIPTVPNPLPVNKGGTNAQDAATARTNLSAAKSGANSDITSITALSTPLTVPQGGTGAGSLTGVVLGNGASAETAVAAASELQYLRRKPNAGATPVYEFASLPHANSADYDFPAQTPGGSLSVGANTITLSPMPAGVTSGSINVAYLYISGGTGAAEAVLITGWTATTVTVTCANTHTGAWTIGSATAGIQEAIFAAGASGAVRLPAGNVYLYGTVTIPDTWSTSVRGAGMLITSLRARFTDKDVVVYGGTTGGNVDFGDLSITNDSGTFHTTGSMLKVRYRVDGLVSNVRASYCYDCFTMERNARALWTNLFASGKRYGLNVTCGGVAYPGCQNQGEVSSFYWIAGDNNTAALHITGATTGLNFIHMFTESGAYGTNNYSVLLEASGSDPLNEILIQNSILDGHSIGVYVVGNGSTCTMNGFQLANNRITASDYGVFLSSSACNVSMTGNRIAATGGGANRRGILLSGTSNVFIGNNPGIGGTGDAAILLQGSNSNTTIIGNNMNDAATGAAQVGVSLGGTITSLRLENNDLRGSVSAYATSATLSGTTTMRNNLGIDNVITDVSSAATVTLPWEPIFRLAGSTDITGITFPWAGGSGARGSLIARDATLKFTAGASIGNSFAAKVGVPVPWYWDGTKLWLGGQDPSLSNSYNYIASETGAANAIAGALTGVTTGDGLCVLVQLGHTLQAGTNTFALNGGSAVSIKSSRNPANNIGTAYAATGRAHLCYNSTGPAWLDMNQ